MSLDSLLKRIGGNHHLFTAKKPEPIPSPVLRDGVRQPNGTFQFRTELSKGVPFVVHSSSDRKNWSPVLNGISTGEMMSFSDSHAAKFNNRFYRLVTGQNAASNMLGYVSMTLPPGFSMISNPLESPHNVVGTLFRDWPDGTTLNKFDTQLFRLVENAVKFTQWTNAADLLKPGEGAIFFNPTMDYRSVCFTGTVLEKDLTVPVPAGFSIRSSIIPQAGHLVDDLKFPIANGDVVHVFDRERQQYNLFPYENGRWTSGAPILAMGEAFWIAKAEPGNWERGEQLPVIPPPSEQN
jgi:hypothetical protein